MKEGIAFAHEHDVKVYVTANILAHNEDLSGVREYFKELKEIKPDALIIADPGVFEIAKEICPEIERHISTQANNTNYATYNFWHKLGASRVVSARELSAKEICPEIERHISTQANNTNYATYNFWHKLGASRVVSARELSLEEIREIRANIPDELEIETFVHGAMCISYSGRCLLSNYFTGRDANRGVEEIREIRANIPDELEIETFVHGAMCISYSGRCLLSNYFTGRDANRGACTHPCRWKYSVVEETRPGEYMPVYENERGTYIFNSKDLCMIQHIPEILESGIDSLKIEGRMKTALYVATVARTYRKAIDDYQKDPALYEKNMPWYLEQISNCTYRQFTTGFFFGKPDETTQIYDSNTYVKEYTYLGIVGEERDGTYRIEQRNKFAVGETIEVMKPNGENISVEVKRILDEDGNEQESAPHPKQVLYVDLGMPLEQYDILRRQEAKEV